MGNLKLEERKKKRKVKKQKKTRGELFRKEVIKEDKENEKIKPIEKKRRKRDKGNCLDNGKGVQLTKEVTNEEEEEEEEEENKKIKPLGMAEKNKGHNVNPVKGVRVVKDNFIAEGKKIKNNAVKKKRIYDEKNYSFGKSDHLGAEDGDGLEKQHDGAEDSPTENQGNIDNSKGKIEEAIDGTEIRACKSKKSKKRRRENDTSLESENLLKKKEVVQDDAYCISSGDEHCSKGMKKWLMEYRQSRPGLKVLRQRIDDFMNAHEEKLYQERKEREAEAAKDGWTVVVHHKGRKKTTDSESGIAVGSVAPAIAQSLSTAKKHKEVNLEFYRFQKRESQRDEILALQSKFEQDRNRIQQLRAARKFKPF